MAEKNSALSMDDAFDFGIMETSTLGSTKAVEALLSDSPLEEEELEEIDPEVEEAKKKAEAKKKQLEEARKAAADKRKAEVEKNKKSAEELVFGEEAEEDEEKTDDEEKEEEEKTEGETEDDATPGNDYESLAKDLIRLGVLSEGSEGEAAPKTGEELLAKFNREKQAGAVQWLDGFLSKFGDDRKELFEAIFVNGVDVREFLPRYVKLEDLKGLDIAKEDNQEMVFREFYRRIKMPADRIESKLQKAKDNGDLEADAKEFHEQLVAQDEEEAEAQKTQAAEKQAREHRLDQEYKAALSKSLMDKVKAKEVNGIPVTQELANKAFDFLHTKKYRTADGTYLTEFDKFILDTKRPDNIEDRVMMALLKLTNFDFSKITKRAVSKQSNELFSTFAQRQAKKAPTAGKKEESTKNWLEHL